MSELKNKFEGSPHTGTPHANDKHLSSGSAKPAGYSPPTKGAATMAGAAKNRTNTSVSGGPNNAAS